MALAGGRPALTSASILTGSLPQPKYFWPIRTCTLPARMMSGAGGTVSKLTNLVLAGSTGSSALRVKTGQPPTEIHAPRSPYLLVAVAMISAQRTGSSLMSKTSTTLMPGCPFSDSWVPSRRRCRL